MDDLFLLKIFSTANLHLHYFHNVVTTFAKTFPCIKARFKYTYWYISTKKLANPNKTLAKKKNKKKLANPKPNIGKQKLKKNWQTQIYFKISLKKNCNYNCLKELLTFSYSIIKVNFLPTDCYICEVVSQLATF